MATNKRYRSPNGSARPYRDGGRWKMVVSEILPTGVQVTAAGTGTTKEKSIARAEKNLKTKVAAALAPAEPGLQTLAGWCQHWLTNIKSGQLRYSTVTSYQHAIDARIKPLIGDVALSDLTIEHIDKLHNEWRQSGLAGSSWVATRTVVKQALDLAVRRGHIASNPAQYAPHAPRQERSPQVLTEEQTCVLIAACSEAVERARWMLSLVLALRQGEVLGLQWGDIDLDSDRPTVRIQRTLQRRTGQGLVTGPPKTAKSRRTLQLPPELAHELQAHRKQQIQYLLSIGVPVTATAHVFTSGFGTPKDPANDRKDWLATLERAGLPKVRLHAARHTSATLMINAGIGIAVVGSILGHSTIATTADIYGHVADDTAGDALRKISAQVTA